MYILEQFCSSQEDYTVRAATSPHGRNGGQPACLPIIAMLPVEGRITGTCHA